jgi:excisionase family DNA binding protein
LQVGVRWHANVTAGRIPANQSEVPMITPLAHSVPEACSIAGAGRTALYEAIRSGALRAVKRGRRTLILDDDLRRWVETLPVVMVKSVAQPGTEGGTND